MVMPLSRWPRLIGFFALALGVFAAPAHAELPPSVEAMIREAGRADTATLVAVVRMAKATNPDDIAAIEALGATFMATLKKKSEDAQMAAKAAEEARLSSLGMFDGWSGQGEAGFGVTSGNTDQLNVLLGVRLAREGLKARHKFNAAADYQQTNGRRSQERYSANYGLNYLLDDGLYIAASLGWERDEFAGFSRRFTESIGLGYRAISKPNMTLDIDGGPALRQTRFNNGFSEDDFGARGSLVYRWTIRPGTSFSEDATVVSSGGNTTLISTSALTAKLTRVFSARISFNVQSETDPLPGRKSTDTATRASIVYSF